MEYIELDRANISNTTGLDMVQVNEDELMNFLSQK